MMVLQRVAESQVGIDLVEFLFKSVLVSEPWI
jgi:hypothetical protein